MSRDGAIWDLMRETSERVGGPSGLDGDAADDDSQQDPVWGDTRRDAAVRVLDAAVGVVGSTRHLLAVLEDVLCEQRERLIAGATAPSPVDSDDGSARERIHLTY